MRVVKILAIASLAIGVAQAADLVVPKEVKLPDLEPLLPPCSDPAADRFLEIDFSQRAPAGATRVQRIGAWVTPDGVFHWPFVMRVRNIGDQPFFGKPNEQAAVLTEIDVAAGNKSREVASVPFDKIMPHSGVAVRFIFTAPADQIAKAKFKRLYTLAIKYKTDVSQSRTGDCNIRNNTFAIEFDGSRKGWVFAK
ncbi:MAG: hypothetical protein HOP13_09975 [Alphaproteobacteria bacterium]|nr:hypothetical protein [Alphaproteobacteria bacterium]